MYKADIDAERATRVEAERQFRLMADAAPIMIWTAGIDRECDWFNAGWLQYTGRAMNEEMGYGWAQAVHEDDFDRCVAIYDTAFDAREPFCMEYRLRRHDGAFRWILDNGAPRFDMAGKFTGYIGSCIDIHNDREREAQLKELLRDKDSLLRELHHRVNNNFQLVVSMISLAARKAPSPEEKGRLREMSDRLAVIAAIHERLVAQPHVGSIDFGEYLTHLTDRLRAIEGRDGVTLVREIATVSLPTDKALPLGLIASEAITNAYKHAFAPRGGTGRLRISLRRDGDAVAMVIADDGVGLGEDPRLDESIGMRLMSALATQAAASLSIESPSGVTVAVRLDAPRD